MGEIRMFCLQCGNRLPEDAVFCNRCGTNVRPSDSGFGGQSPQKPGSRAKIWGVGLRQLVAMLIGTVLYIVFRSFIVFWGFHGIIYTNMLFIIPAIIIPLFFGATFGPWVGLVIGGIGTAISSNITPWDFITFSPATRAMSRQLLFLDQSLLLIVLGSALIGFIAGLALYGTRGHYNTFRSIVIADIVGAIGIILGLGLVITVSSSSSLSTAFTHLILPNVVVSLVLLPILLSTYNVVTQHITSS
jgi:energy-coupling factor transport system substrate-specific component